MAGEWQETAGAQVGAPLFASTHWSVVLRARDKSEAALGSLCSSYRRPIIAWLRCHGFNLDDAEDVTQAFLAHLLSRDFLQRVTPDKGRFRTFLLHCLKNYLGDQRDKSAAQKRGGGRSLGSLDETDENGRPLLDPADGDPAPDLEFDRAWAHAILEKAKQRLQHECATTGHRALWAALEPAMFADETASPYRQIAQQLGMSETAVKVAAHRIRTRLKGVIRDEVLQTVASEQELQHEIRYLIALFAR
jgi:RNA polymerase sigma factor (sigma-70 family)